MDGPSTAKLGFASNGGSFVYSSVFEIKYSSDKTPEVSGMTPSRPKYEGGQSITLTGTGFINAGEDLAFSRGKKNRKPKKTPAFVYDTSARTVACDHLTVNIGTIPARVL